MSGALNDNQSNFSDIMLQILKSVCSCRVILLAVLFLIVAYMLSK